MLVKLWWVTWESEPSAPEVYLCPLVLLGLNAECTCSIFQWTIVGSVLLYDLVSLK